MVKASVVILNWNGQKFLEKFLPSVVENSQHNGYEVIVADNASTDGSIAFMQNTYPKVRLILLDKNYGFAGGYNKALEQVEATYYILLNSDVEVSPHWISPVIRMMDQDSAIAAAMPKLLSYHDKHYFEYAGAAGGFIDKYGYPFCRGRIFDEVERDLGQFDKECEIFWATGACLFVRSDLYKKVGGFDEDFFAHMEEIDLCWRLKNRGYKIMYTPESAVFHVGGGSLPKSNPWKTYLNFRNNLWLLYKNLPPRVHKRIMFARMILDFFSILKFLANRKPSDSWAIVRAHISFWGKINHIRRKRKETLLQATVFDHKEVYQHSIVAAFFLHNQRTTNQLSFNQD
jgi:GT2 family glycosyltransferase